MNEVEKQKYNPVLYKQYAANQGSKQLKNKLDELYDDEAFKENVMKKKGWKRYIYY